MQKGHAPACAACKYFPKKRRQPGVDAAGTEKVGPAAFPKETGPAAGPAPIPYAYALYGFLATKFILNVIVYVPFTEASPDAGHKRKAMVGFTFRLMSVAAAGIR